MTELPNDEVRARLSAIASGPWSRGLIDARQHLAPRDPVPVARAGREELALDRLTLSSANKRKSARLTKVLRAHFDSDEPIDDPREIAARDAFDQALTVPQLWELAVQTGYLPEAAVRKPARRVLTELLWSDPARQFVHAYDYVSVPLLARRVGVSGLGPALPPAPNPNAALHFAGFLAHLRAFYADNDIDTWIRFLDDYVVETGEQQRLWEYLRAKRQKPPQRLAALLVGCQAFVSSLADAFDVLGDEELGAFGLLHGYWLERFFGYERDSSGLFVKDVDIWGKTDSWARTMAESPRLVPEGTDPAIEKVLRRQFVRRVAVLERTFAAVRTLAKQTRAQASRTAAQPPGALHAKDRAKANARIDG